MKSKQIVGIHETAIDFIQRFTSENLNNREAIEEFFDQSTLDKWIATQYPDVLQRVQQAISLVARPYFEHEDQPVYVVLFKDTLFITGHSDSAISFIRPHELGNPKQILLDIPHAGTKPPSCVDGLLSDQVIADESVCSSNPYTIWNQADVGVLEVSGAIWRNYQNVACGSAVLTNLIISNGNRAPAEEGRTNHVYNTHTYRGTYLYKEPQQPKEEIKRALKQNHDLSISAAAACRAAAYIANPHNLIICLEPHSYSMFSHEILNALFAQDTNINLSQFAPPNSAADDGALIKYLRNTYDYESVQKFIRPLVSVLDVSSDDKPDKYSTVTEPEMNAFVYSFLSVLEQSCHSFPINLDDWEKSRPDVYGAANSILNRLEALINKADSYVGAHDEVIAQTINTVTIEYNRGLVTSGEASTIQTSENDFNQHCQLVGAAFVAGLKNMQNYSRTKLD